MKTTVLGTAVALAWCVAAPIAQQQPAPTTPNPPAHNVFVATGCLNAGADGAAAFKLTDASAVGRAAPARAPEAGAVGTSGLKASYELQPVSGVNAQGMDADALKAHIGQRVEVTLRPIQTPAAPDSPTAGSLGVTAVKPADAPPERFSVTALKRVSGSCS
jgi:hypothetical protein